MALNVRLVCKLRVQVKGMKGLSAVQRCERSQFGRETPILCMRDGGLGLPESPLATNCSSFLLPPGLFLQNLSLQK